MPRVTEGTQARSEQRGTEDCHVKTGCTASRLFAHLGKRENQDDQDVGEGQQWHIAKHPADAEEHTNCLEGQGRVRA